MDVREYTRAQFKLIRRADEPELEGLMRDLLFTLQDALASAHRQSPAEARAKLKTLWGYWVEGCRLSERDGQEYNRHLYSGLLLNLVSNPEEAKRVFDLLGIGYDAIAAAAAKDWIEMNWSSDPAAIGLIPEDPEPLPEAIPEPEPELVWNESGTRPRQGTSIWILDGSELTVYHPAAEWELTICEIGGGTRLIDLLHDAMTRDQLERIQDGHPITVKRPELVDDLIQLLDLWTEDGVARRGSR